MLRLLRIAVALLGGLLAAPRVAAAFSCAAADGAGCPVVGTTCWVACAEDDLRATLALLDRCGTHDVVVAMGPDADTTCGAVPIPMRMDPTAPATAPGACGDDHVNRYNALCLTGNGIVLDGRGAVFQYTGDHICASCDGECTLCPGEACASRQPALLVLRGNRNTVRDLDMRFFPEGIHLRAGDGHTVEGVVGRYVCEEALTIDGGDGHRVAGNTFSGQGDARAAGGACHLRLEDSACRTDADCAALRTGARCYCGSMAGLGACAAPPPPPGWPLDTPGQCFLPTPCGLDKAIQVNDGSSRIESNRIDAIGQPVSVLAGTHVVAGNVTCGDPKDRNVCQAYGVRGGVVTFRDNRIDHCKFGIRLDRGAEVEAVGNVITNGWVSAFHVKGQGAARLRAAGNLMRNNGYATESDCERGALVVASNPLARVDLTGNVSCQAGTGAAHVWNGSSCACSGAGCTDVGASIGLSGDAFDPPLVLPPGVGANVVDDPPLETRVVDTGAYDDCGAIVVDECACPGGRAGEPCRPDAGTLRVSRAVVRLRRDADGTVIVRGSLAGRPPGAGGLSLEIPGLLPATIAWQSDECTTLASGRVACSAADRAARARFTPHGPGVHLFRVVVEAPVLLPRAGAEVTVVLAYDGARRVGSLAGPSCRTKGSGLRCRER